MQGFRIVLAACCISVVIQLVAGQALPSSGVPTMAPNKGPKPGMKLSAPAPAPQNSDTDYSFHRGGKYTDAVPTISAPMDLIGTAAAPSPAATPTTAPVRSANALNNVAAAPAAAAGCNASSDTASLLFIQQAKLVTFTTQRGLTLMVLSNVTSQTIFFADKPERYAGMIGTDYFSTDRIFYSNTSNQWLDAPNAALFGTRGNKPQNNTVVIVTLHDPVYDAAAATLSYNVTFVPERHVGSIANFYRRHKSAPAFTKVLEKVEGKAFLKDVALFTDNFQSTDLLNPDPVDNTYIPGGGFDSCFGGGWGWGNGCGGAWW
ncbi:g9503 [Coccomyxa elongata]